MFGIKKLATGPIDMLVVGLGNPGKQYENTRHNAGFMAVDSLAAHYGVKLDRLRFKSLCGQARTSDGQRLLIMKPTTFMNLSGQAVMEAMQFYKIPPERVLVIFDDISLEPGKLRIRRSGSDGGQKGMKNIIYLSGSDAFPRIKIGVGAKPHPDYDLADWVLSRFSKAEMTAVTDVIANVPDITELIASGSIDKAMGKYN